MIFFRWLDNNTNDSSGGDKIVCLGFMAYQPLYVI